VLDRSGMAVRRATARAMRRCVTLARLSSPDRRSGTERRAGAAFRLSSRERVVLDLVLRGEPNKEIARRIGVAEQMVKAHVSELFRKFGVPNRAALGVAGAHLELIGPALLERSWFPQLFRTATMQIAVSRGPSHLYVAVNAAFARAVGRDVVGRTMREAFPELADSGHIEIADRVYQTGESFVAHESPAVWDPGAGATLTYTDAVVQALRGEDDAIEGLAYFGMDVTDHVRSRATEASTTSG
jgi:DNA-binding CsgD family transcriptional regulator